MPIVGPRSYGNIIETFIQFGADVEKISLQMALFGSSFKRSSTLSLTDYDLAAGQPKSAGLGSFLYSDGLFTDEKKNPFTYNLHTQTQICKLEKDQNWTKVRDHIQKTPYAFTNIDWISYDDMESFKYKVNLIVFIF